jgi:hypothetical protein
MSSGCLVVELALVMMVVSKFARRNAVVMGFPKLPEACCSSVISYVDGGLEEIITYANHRDARNV